MPSSIRTGSGSSITSDASSSSCYYNSKNGKNSMKQRLTKINSNGNDIDMDDGQPLSLNSVGGYVDDLMERIRKMPPKKRSRFYQMLDAERLKDLNNNNHEKSKSIDCHDDDHHDERRTVNMTMPLVVADMHSDEEEDRTLIEISSNPSIINDSDQEKLKQQFLGLNDKNYEELLAMGIPLTVLKAIILHNQQQAQSLNNSNVQLSNFLSDKCTLSPTNNSIDNKHLLNARTILRRILQQQEQHEQQQQQQGSNSDKPLPEPMDYTTDEETGIVEDEDDDDEHRSSTRKPHHNRNNNRPSSHNPATVLLNSNDISSLSPLTSISSSSPDQNDVHHPSNTNSLSRPSSNPTALVSSTCPV